MSTRHPIIAVTGSSGAGTTTVMKSFNHIFRRENIRAQIVEGDSMHRYDRKAMRAAMTAMLDHEPKHPPAAGRRRSRKVGTPAP